jgi:hypothetical protein
MRGAGARSGPGRKLLRLQPAARRRHALWLFLVFLCACGAGAGNLAWGAAQAAVSPDATPGITSVQPSKARAGATVTLTIDGERFAQGAYVSFSDPAIHVLATRRLSDKRLEVDVAIGDKAPAELAHLYVANPAGTSAESTFAIVSSAPVAAQPAASAPGSPAAAETPASASASPAPAEPIPAGAAAPEVSKVDPSHVAAGSKASIKVTGKKFVKGAKVAFQNPGIRVLGTEFKKSTQLVAEIEVASNAATGKTSMFVVNPDDSEVETSFEVTAAGSGSSQSGSQKAAAGSAANTASQTFSVINLGDAISILQNPSKPRGTLVLAGGKLTYQEAGKDVFVAGPGEVKEVAPNILFGFNTSTFHIILNSGKTYNFVAASLTPSETAAIITALQKAFPQ